MTSPFPDAAGPVAGAVWHAGEDLLASYAAGTCDEVASWSVEAHLTACARCRSALSEQVDAQRLARNRSVLLVRAAIGDGGAGGVWLRRCGVPDHLIRLVAATPSLRRSWLLSVMGVLAVVTGEAAAVRFGWIRQPERAHGRVSGSVGSGAVPAGGSATGAGWGRGGVPANVRSRSPAGGRGALLRLHFAAGPHGLRAGRGAGPGGRAAFVLPGPGWLPVALLLPSLALCAFALAAATVMDPRAAAVTATALWVLPVLRLTITHVPLTLVAPPSQAVCAAVLCTCAVALFLRRDRFELGRMR